MKIILHFDDLAKEAEQIIIEWLEELIKDKSAGNTLPLRYVDKMEVMPEENLSGG